MQATYSTYDIWLSEQAKLKSGETLQLETIARWCESRVVFPHAWKEGNIWRIPVQDYNPDTFIRPQPGRPFARFEGGYVSVREAANIADVAEATIRSWIYQKKLPAELRKGGYAIKVDDLDIYLKTR